MNEELYRKKFTAEIDLSNWADLHHHMARASLFWLKEGDLVELAVNVAMDRKELIEKLTEQQLLIRPDGHDIARWHKEKRLFECLVVSPFVFIRESSECGELKAPE